jgi:hypothetical protein
MRRLVDILAVVTLLVGLGALGWWSHRDHAEEALVDRAAAAVARFEREIGIRAAMQNDDPTKRSWPVTIDEGWFEGKPPRNPLLSAGLTGERPWVEVAPPHHATLTDPPVRIALSSTDAAFWYNPANGVIRARVGSNVSDQRALEMYNRVNRTELESIHRLAPKPEELTSASDGSAGSAGPSDR